MLKSKIKDGLLKKGLFKFDYPPLSVFNEQQGISPLNNWIIENKLAVSHDKYKHLFDRFSKEINLLKEIPLYSKNGKLGWLNSYYPGLDIISLYSLVKMYNPNRIIEVGSGYSTLVIEKALKSELGKSYVTCIDPFPRTEILSTGFEIVKQKVEEQDPDIFSSLRQGDFLIIDSSHRILPGSDVEYLFEYIIPFLPSGVFVHVHDIYLPFNYPQVMKKRLYSEQQILSQILYYEDRYQVVFPAFYCFESGHFNEEISKVFKGMEPGIERHGGAFWFSS